MSFIKSRMNKDNFWNLMFWLGMSLCSGSFVLFSEYKYDKLSFLFFLLTILGIPFIVKKCTKITFNKENGFFNSKGESLKNRHPRAFGIVFFASIGIAALVGGLIDKHGENLDTSIGIIILFSTFFLIPTLYFIYKNCPISILFNKNAWCEEVTGITPNAHSMYNGSSSIHKSNNINNPTPINCRHSPNYSWMVGNIYYRK